MTTKALSTVSAPSLPIDASTLPDDARLSHLIRNDHLLRALGTKCDKLIKQRAVLIKLIPALIERRTEAVDKYNDLAKERNAQVDVHKAMVDKLQKMLGPMEFVRENAQLVSDLLDSSNQQIEVLKSSSKLLQLAELHVRKQDAELVALRDRLEQIDKELKEGVEEMRVLSGGICGCCMDGEEHERKKELGEREVGKIQDTNSTTSNDEFTKKLSELTLADPTEVKEEPTKQVDQVKQVKQKDGKKEDKQRVGA